MMLRFFFIFSFLTVFGRWEVLFQVHGGWFWFRALWGAGFFYFHFVSILFLYYELFINQLLVSK
jgi:hypothetical protein